MKMRKAPTIGGARLLTMAKGWRHYWKQVGIIDRAFLASILLYTALFFTGRLPSLQTFVGLSAVLLGVVSLFRLGRLAMKSAIWRLRNRLIAAYYFIAVVPIVLIVALVAIAS